MFTAIALITQAAALASGTPTSAESALADLEGEWQGRLEYRDYQSDTMQSIPMNAVIESVPDDTTQIQRFRFVDPRSPVYSTNLISMDGETVSYATSRQGRPFETYQQSARLVQSDQASGWTVVLARIGQDDNRPASIRETILLNGNNVTLTKEVDFLDDDKNEWAFRNRAVLSRVQD